MESAVYDASYDVLISYRRRDAKIAAHVEELTKSITRSVFRDVNEHVAGYDWRTFWRAALAKQPDPAHNPGVGPLVAVLVTPEVANLRDQDEVVREIIEALTSPLETPVSLLEFDHHAVKVLIDEITRRDPVMGQKLRDAHRIALHDFPVSDPTSATPEQRAALHNGLRRAARPALRRRLLAQRDRTLEWARDLLSNFLCPDIDLSSQTGATLRI